MSPTARYVKVRGVVSTAMAAALETVSLMEAVFPQLRITVHAPNPRATMTTRAMANPTSGSAGAGFVAVRADDLAGDRRDAAALVRRDAVSPVLAARLSPVLADELA